MSFSDMIKVTFNDKSFISSIAPVLYDMIRPLIEDTIHATVLPAINSMKTTCIDPIISANIELGELIENQNKTIKDQSKLIDGQNKVLTDQETVIKKQKIIIE